MAITKPIHGAKIKKSDISGMHDEARTIVNDLKGVNLGRDSLGPQALPSVVKAADFSGSTTKQTVDSANEYLNGSLSDITTNWKLLSDWTTTGPGVLPPCKVLVYFNCRVSKVESTVSPDEIWDIDSGPAPYDTYRNIATRHQLWLALGYHNGTSEVFDLTDTGVVFSGNLVLRNAQYQDPDDFSQAWLPSARFSGEIRLPDFPTATNRGHFVEHPISFWMVIDKTASSSDWTLQDIRVRVASRGAAAISTSRSEEEVHNDGAPIVYTYTAPRWTLLTSQIGYIAFQKDE